jgi:hypothetical protein
LTSFSRAAKSFKTVQQKKLRLIVSVFCSAESFGIANKRNSGELFKTLEETRARRKSGAVKTMKEITTELSTREHRRR